VQTIFSLKSEDTHTKKVSASVRRLTELDSKVFLWIDHMLRANCRFHLNSPLKANELAEQLYQIVNFSNIMFRV